MPSIWPPSLRIDLLYRVGLGNDISLPPSFPPTQKPLTTGVVTWPKQMNPILSPGGLELGFWDPSQYLTFCEDTKRWAMRNGSYTKKQKKREVGSSHLHSPTFASKVQALELWMLQQEMNQWILDGLGWVQYTLVFPGKGGGAPPDMQTCLIPTARPWCSPVEQKSFHIMLTSDTTLWPGWVNTKNNTTS